jgi:hypothetical protein
VANRKFTAHNAWSPNEVLKPLLTQAGLNLPDPVLLEVSHTLVEYAADLLISRGDRSIGASMLSAARTRDNGFPGLLVKAYAQGLADTFSLEPADAAALIMGEEAKFRQLIVLYAKILQHGDRQALL